MSQLRVTQTSSADDADGRVWGVEGRRIWVIFAALIVSGAMFLFATLRWHWSNVTALSVGSLPTVLALVWAHVAQASAPGFMVDVAESAAAGRSFGGPHVPRGPLALLSFLSPEPPPIYLVRDLLIFGQPAPGGWVSRGFELVFNDLESAPESVLNDLQDQLRLSLRALSDAERLQWIWRCDSDFSEDHVAYAAATASCTNAWARRCREQRLERYQKLMQEGKLRRQRLVVFRSRRIDFAVPRGFSPRDLEHSYGAALDQLALEFEQWGNGVGRALAGHGIQVVPLTDREHFNFYAHHFNPSLAERFPADPWPWFDPDLPLQDSVALSEAVAHRDTGFVCDQYEHALLVVTRLPQSSQPGLMRRLTQVGLRDFSITLCAEPLPVSAEIEKEERSYKRVEAELAREKRVGLKSSLEMKDRKVNALRQGHLRPFHLRWIVSVWARDRAALRAHVLALKQAIQSMNGAQYHEPNLPATTRKLWQLTWPGWLGSSYPHFKLYADDTVVSDLVPMSASFRGAPGRAEAIYESPQGSLVRVNGVEGGGDAMNPIHSAVFGGTSSGKSVTLADLLSQKWPHLKHLFVLDAGRSHEAWLTVAMPAVRPIVVRPNGSITIGYLDSFPLPLTPDHFNGVLALLSALRGKCDNEASHRHDQALLLKAVQQLYDDVFADWERTHPDETLELARLAVAIEEECARHPDQTFLDAFLDLREREKVRPAETRAFLQQIDERKVFAMLKEPRRRKSVRNLAFSRIPPAEQPTHQMLVELLLLEGAGGDRQTARALGEQLRRYCRDGSVGPLFDGVNNVSFDHGPLVYLELGEIPSTDQALRDGALTLVFLHLWRHILGLSRSERKEVIYEEAAGLISNPEAAQMVARCYRESRKYNTSITSCFQDYAALSHSPIREAVMTNCRQFFIMRMDDPQDVQHLADDLGLSPTAVAAIKSYPAPSSATGASFTYFRRQSPMPICGTAINHVSPEMLYVARSDGPHMVKRRKELAGDPSTILERVIAHAPSPS